MPNRASNRTLYRVIAPLAVAAALALSGCAKDAASYPSLSIRDAERVTGTFEPAPAPDYVPPKPASDTLSKAGQLRADAQTAHTKFLAVAASIHGAEAGRSAAEGTDAWAAAQTALAQLAAARSQTMIPLADLDSLYAAAQNDGDDVSELEQARSDADALVATEDKVIDSFEGS